MKRNPIREALALLEPRGAWMKETYRNERSNGKMGYCMVGALNEVHAKDSALKIVAEVIHEQFPRANQFGLQYGIPEFNDRSRTRKKDVLMIMEKAAVKWDELA